jgi:hypothetical protein
MKPYPFLQKYARAAGLAFALVLILLAHLAAPASAKRWVPPPAPSTVVLPAPAALKLGDPLDFYAQLRDTNGNALPGRALDFYIDFVYYGQSRTDINGMAIYQSKKLLPAGEHVLTVNYQGAHDLQPSRQSRKLIILPTMVTVQTVPPMAGVTYNMDGRDFVSGPDGMASILIYKMGRFTLSAKIEKFSDPDTRIQFGRWEVESYQPFRDVDVPTTEPIQAGLDVFHRVGQAFVDLDGKPVDMQRVEKITIKSNQGDVFTFTDGSLQWVPASRVARRLNGLEVTPVQYSVMNVTVVGSNVVNQAQQRFYIQPNDIWYVQLLLYSVKINARDGLLGSPVGKRVRVEFPNGEVHTYPLDSNGTAEIRSLARGIYRIQITGVQGMISPTPVALSRNQEVNLRVITNQDMFIAAVVGLAVALGLLLLGRPWLLQPILRHRRVRALLHDDELTSEVEGIASIHNN